MSITVSNISKRFGEFVALDNVSLDFPTGQLIALLGPSGCGKTTLLRIIAGLEYADQGRIVLDGSDASSLHVRERNVGFVFQHYALFRHMTVAGNIGFGLRILRGSAKLSDAMIKAKVEELLELVQLGGLANRFPAQLSGGQRQRVALARALAVHPRVLLLDEPFGALDAKVRKELRRWLRRLHNDLHITSVFVTHDQEEAFEVADTVVLMNKGKIEQIGSPADVYNSPATPFVYSFLGSVNTFKGKVEGPGVRVGAGLLPHSDANIRDGSDVIAFARPHELDIIVDPAATAGVSAKVERILNVGPVARIELTGLYRNGTNTVQNYEVEVPREDLGDLSLSVGQTVRLVSSRLKVFADQVESRTQ